MAGVNYLELAKQQRALDGECALAELPRLQQALLELGVEAIALAPVSVRYHLQGLVPRYFGEQVLPVLKLTLQTTLPLVCQRCFGTMPESVDASFVYAICQEAPEALEMDDEVDWLEPEVSADVHALVEDELLMLLPIAVMHAHDCAELQQSAGERVSPFAALKALKK